MLKPIAENTTSRRLPVGAPFIFIKVQNYVSHSGHMWSHFILSLLHKCDTICIYIYSEYEYVLVAFLIALRLNMDTHFCLRHSDYDVWPMSMPSCQVKPPNNVRIVMLYYLACECACVDKLSSSHESPFRTAMHASCDTQNRLMNSDNDQKINPATFSFMFMIVSFVGCHVCSSDHSIMLICSFKISFLCATLSYDERVTVSSHPFHDCFS